MSKSFDLGQQHSHITGLYDLEKTIGQGHFAIVKSAKHIFSGERVAIKIIDKLKLDNVSREHLFQEVKCMKLVQHPNVVRLYEVIDTPTKLYLILELGDGGDMYDYIMKHSNGLSESKARVYFRQIVKAIKYCHDLRVVHRDLKPENVVFFSQTGQVKLTDFGFSNIYEPNSKLLTSCGSLAYSAPEILLGDSYYAPPVDIWSLGVILYMLVTGRAPFQEANDSETLTMILDCKYYLPEYLTFDCKDLISRMIVRDPTKRISLNDIQKHDWFINMNRLSSNESFSEDELNPNNTDKNLELPLVKRELISKSTNDLIIKQMLDGNIVNNREEIESNLQQDKYNYITATYYLLAERIFKKEMLLKMSKRLKKKPKFDQISLTKRKILAETQNSNSNNNNNNTQSSLLSKNQFSSNILKMQQRNLLLRQDQAKEEDEFELENQECEKPTDLEVIEPKQEEIKEHLTNIIEDEEEEEKEEINTNLSSKTIILSSSSQTRRSSRGTCLTSDNQISKLTIPEEDLLTENTLYKKLELDSDDLETSRYLSPSVIKSLRDEAILKLNSQSLSLEQQDETNTNPKKLRNSKYLSTDSDSENEFNSARKQITLNEQKHDWNRSASASSSSRSRNKLRAQTTNRPLSISSENSRDELNAHNHNTNQTLSPINAKTLSVEHRLANMSQMSISSQLSKNNSFRFHRTTLTGSETPNQLFNQQISSTTPTPRESIVFNRGDGEKPIAKILQQSQMNQSFRSNNISMSQNQNLVLNLSDSKSKSFDLSADLNSNKFNLLNRNNSNHANSAQDGFNLNKSNSNNSNFSNHVNDSYTKAIYKSNNFNLSQNSNSNLNLNLINNNNNININNDNLNKNSDSLLSNNNNNNDLNHSRNNSIELKKKKDKSCSKCCNLL